MFAPPSRGCKKKLPKQSKLDPQPPKKKVIRKCATAGPATMNLASTMCNSNAANAVVVVPTPPFSSSSASSTARTFIHRRTNKQQQQTQMPNVSRPSTRPSTNININVEATAIRTNVKQHVLVPVVVLDKISTQQTTMMTTKTVTNGQSSTSSADEKTLFEVDKQVLNKYKLIDRLGKGAYGVVWNAEEKRTGKQVALKKIFGAFRNNTDAQRTYREIIFLREFGSHPNILNVHRAMNNLDIYLTFPLLDSDLHKVIKQGTNLKDNVIRFIFYQILKAVKFLHSAEVIHRDLKPANILLAKNFNVKVGDFGLARSLEDLTSEIGFVTCENTSPMTEYVATRWYRPPEILLANRSYSKGVDMWGLGCILGEMLLRKAVFAGSTTREQIEIIMSIIPQPPLEEIQELCASGTPATIKLVENAAQKRGTALYDLFLNQACNHEAIDLIGKLLVFNPNQRITIEEAISHSYVERYRDESEEITLQHPVLPPLDDNVHLHMTEYRFAIYNIINFQRVRPMTSGGVSARSTAAPTPRASAISQEKKPEMNLLQPQKVRPGVGRKSNNAPATNIQHGIMNDGGGGDFSPDVNLNHRLKSIKSTIAWAINKSAGAGDSQSRQSTAIVNRQPESEQQLNNHCFVDLSDSMEHLHDYYCSQVLNASPPPKTRLDDRQQHQHQYEHNIQMLNGRPQTMEPIVEVEMDELSDYYGAEYENEFTNSSLQQQRSLQHIPPSLNNKSDRALPLLVTQSEGDLYKECERNRVRVELTKLDDYLYDDEHQQQQRDVQITRAEHLPLAGRNNGKGGRGVNQVQQPIVSRYAESVRRPSIPPNRRPVSKDKLETNDKDLALAQNLKETTSDWYYQGIQGSRQSSNNRKIVQQKQHIAQTRLPPKPPSRNTTSFHIVDENRPRVQHSSYFPDKDKYNNSYNPKVNSLGVPWPKQ